MHMLIQPSFKINMLHIKIHLDKLFFYAQGLSAAVTPINALMHHSDINKPKMLPFNVDQYNMSFLNVIIKQQKIYPLAQLSTGTLV